MEGKKKSEGEELSSSVNIHLSGHRVFTSFLGVKEHFLCQFGKSKQEINTMLINTGWAWVDISHSLYTIGLSLL